MNIIWNIYQDVNGSTTQWAPFNQVENDWFFGKCSPARSHSRLLCRKKHDQLHHHESPLPEKSSCALLALRSGLFLHQRDKFKCIELRHQPTAEQRILLDRSSARNNKHALHGFMHRLVRRQRNQRLRSVRLHTRSRGANDARFQLSILLQPSTALTEWE